MKENLIIRNKSSRPLYEFYDKAFDYYFQYWSEEQADFAVTWDLFKFHIKTNKKSITITIYDLND